jgi:glucose-1-phosphate adenylyltransferase
MDSIMAVKPARFVSRLTQNTLALVLAGGRGTRLGVLTDWRTKPAVPFGGKFRIIDFTLSNCINSGINHICVLTQYKSHSLIQHLLQGWNSLNSQRGQFLDILPAQQWLDDESWYQGTADAVYQSLDIIDGYDPEYVLILAGDHIYTMDYGEMLAQHVEKNADITIACNSVSLTDAHHFGIMRVDESHRIVDFEEKPPNPQPSPDDPDSALASMGIYIFSSNFLRSQLIEDAADKESAHNFGKNIIPKALQAGFNLQAYQFHNPHKGKAHYWRDVGTIDALFQANLEIVSPDPPLDVYDPDWPIYTYQPQLPSAHFVGEQGENKIGNSVISGGCVVNRSSLHNAVLFSNVKVGNNCELHNAVIMPGCEIGDNCRLNNVFIDNQCIISRNTVIGEDPEKDAKHFKITEEGVVVVNRKMLGQGVQYMPGIVPETMKS